MKVLNEIDKENYNTPRKKKTISFSILNDSDVSNGHTLLYDFKCQIKLTHNNPRLNRKWMDRSDSVPDIDSSSFDFIFISFWNLLWQWNEVNESKRERKQIRSFRSLFDFIDYILFMYFCFFLWTYRLHNF